MHLQRNLQKMTMTLILNLTKVSLSPTPKKVSIPCSIKGTSQIETKDLLPYGQVIQLKDSTTSKGTLILPSQHEKNGSLDGLSPELPSFSSSQPFLYPPLSHLRPGLFQVSLGRSSKETCEICLWCIQ